ncbi:hypothetical protein [Streptomyces sp. NPDC050504]|uniref:hypothetical protein n=1 Tax=Streptomyces sp. NPDC050504 TaxID=3365618 RepID=UPI0037942A59
MPTNPPHQAAPAPAPEPPAERPAVVPDPGPVAPGRPHLPPGFRPVPRSTLTPPYGTQAPAAPEPFTAPEPEVLPYAEEPLYTAPAEGLPYTTPTAPAPVPGPSSAPLPPAPLPPAPLPPAPHSAPLTRSRPAGARRPGRTAAAAACLVLGLGLIGGAATGSLLIGDSAAGTSGDSAYTDARALWHSVPVDRLFPRTLQGDGAGPGGADRTWTRIGVAPDSVCEGALDPLLVETLQPVGCLSLLRATYTDATTTSVTTVGMVFTEADSESMAALGTRFTEQGLDERTDLMPRALPAKGTVAADFGDKQRASWTVKVLTKAPVVVFAVSGFADGRAVSDPQPAAEAMAKGSTTPAAQAGLGNEAKGVADAVERALRAASRKDNGA